MVIWHLSCLIPSAALKYQDSYLSKVDKDIIEGKKINKIKNPSSLDLDNYDSFSADVLNTPR